MGMKQLETRRLEILSGISQIKSMRKGSVNDQYIYVKHKDGETVKKGPYGILTFKGDSGKTRTESIPEGKRAFYESEAANYKRYRMLTDEYIKVCDEISRLADDDGSLHEEQGKKNR